MASEGDSAAALRGAVDVVRLEGGDAGDLGAVEQDECTDCPDVGGQVGVADASGEQGDLLVLVDEVRRFAVAPSGDGRTGAHFSAELGKAFWVTPADHASPGPVTDWRRVGP